MLHLPPPEPLALLQAAAEDSVTAGLASLPQDLRGFSSRNVVMLRGRRRVFLIDKGKLRRLSGGHRHARLGDPYRTL